MEQIEQGVYIETSYPGVTLGAISQSRGTLLIDAPPCPQDARSWRAALRNLGSGVNHLLINLDDHHDRTLGVRTLETPVLAHTRTAEAILGRPAVFKQPPDESGSEWEDCIGLSGVRWAPPSIAFEEHVRLHWNQEPVVVEHRPGPAPGAAWVVLPEKGIVFIGDAVLPNQPPFMANAQIEDWIETLDVLLSAAYRNFLVISGRGGAVAVEAIREQRRALRYIERRMNALADREAAPEATEQMIKVLLSKINFPARRREQYVQRLRFGLYQYYVRNHRPAVMSEEPQ